MVEGEYSAQSVYEPQQTPAAQELTTPSAVSSDMINEILKGLEDAAEKGTEALKAEVKTLHPRYEPYVRAALDRRLKPRAVEVDQGHSNG